MSDGFSEFEMDVMHAIRQSLIKAITGGNWVQIPYEGRPTIPVSRLRSIFEQIDWVRVQAMCVERVEEMVAEKIMLSMATEVANDVKQIMCNKELREDLRATLRDKIRKGVSAITEGGERC